MVENKENTPNGNIINYKLDQLNGETKEVNKSIQEMHRDLLNAINKMATSNIQVLQKLSFKQEALEKELTSKNELLETIRKKANINIYALIPIIGALITIIITLIALTN